MPPYYGGTQELDRFSSLRKATELVSSRVGWCKVTLLPGSESSANHIHGHHRNARFTGGFQLKLCYPRWTYTDSHVQGNLESAMGRSNQKTVALPGPRCPCKCGRSNNDHHFLRACLQLDMCPAFHHIVLSISPMAWKVDAVFLIRNCCFKCFSNSPRITDLISNSSWTLNSTLPGCLLGANPMPFHPTCRRESVTTWPRSPVPERQWCCFHDSVGNGTVLGGCALRGAI